MFTCNNLLSFLQPSRKKSKWMNEENLPKQLCRNHLKPCHVKNKDLSSVPSWPQSTPSRKGASRSSSSWARVEVAGVPNKYRPIPKAQNRRWFRKRTPSESALSPSNARQNLGTWMAASQAFITKTLATTGLATLKKWATTEKCMKSTSGMSSRVWDL